jgi:hypothetical protein
MHSQARIRHAALSFKAMKPTTETLSTADVVLLIHALKAYALESKRDPRLANDMKALATKVQALYPDAQQKGGAR